MNQVDEHISTADFAGYDKVAGRRVVLTGGACQLPGARELAGLILDKQIRIGRPMRVAGLAEATGGPAFSTGIGLLHFAMSERAETARNLAKIVRDDDGQNGKAPKSVEFDDRR